MVRGNVTIIGAGSMGTAASVLLADNGFKVNMYSCFEDEAAMINTQREQKDKLPGVRIPDNVVCHNDMEAALNNSDSIVLAIPSQTVRENVKKLALKNLNKRKIICFSKGLEENTCLRMSQVIEQEIKDANTVIMSGPCHAEEMASKIPTAYVAASKHKKEAAEVQDMFMSSAFRVYTNTDTAGVELGGALKNVIAICAGISDGLGFGDNTKAALMTRGMFEIQRLGVEMGAKAQTFSGLTGIGDLIVTCTSMHSRNRRAGILLGKGYSLADALKEVEMVVEGVKTAKAAYKLAIKHNIEMPITTEAYKILFEGKNAGEAVIDLMTRKRKNEMIF